jgi:hypothetical protein
VFIGHYALGLAAKRLAPRTSLGTLIAAPTLADLLWPVFLLTGWEHVTSVGGTNPFLTLSFDSYPISHSLITLIGWGLLFGILYQSKSRYVRGAAVVGLLVVSHWVLDYVVHIPDLPLYPGGAKVGLGLWKSPPATIAIETLMFVVGVGVYLATTRARDRVGRYGFAAFASLLVLSYVGSLFAPPPANIRALAIGAIVFGWLFVWLAGWGDAHRDTVARRYDATLPESSPRTP